jgi:hypothetical protein
LVASAMRRLMAAIVLGGLFWLIRGVLRKKTIWSRG